MTTIKIEADLRDRINDEARRRGQTAGSFVEEMFALWLREQRLARIRDALAASATVDIAYADEVAGLDALAGDGLPPEPMRLEPDPVAQDASRPAATRLPRP